MKLVRFMLVALMLLAFPMIVQAYQDIETELMRWPEANLEFEYPTGLNLLSAEGFEFVLADDTGNFVGLQMGAIEGTLEELFAGFAEGSESEPEAFEVNGVSAFSFPVPTDQNGREGRVIGYMVDEHNVALLVMVGQPDWVEINANVLDSVVITPVEVDAETLNEQLSASFEQDQVLRVGSDDAPVKIVEVLDFSCPHCVNYGESIKRIVQEYVTSGQVQIEFRFVTFVGDEASVLATTAQYCAVEQGLGWDMHEAIFEGYKNESLQFYTEANFVTIIDELDGEVGAFSTCLEEQPYGDIIERDAELSAELGVQSTPSILFATGDETPQFLQTANGENWRGGIQLYFLYQEIDKLLAA